MDDYIRRADALKMKFHDGINDDGLLYVPYRDVEKHLRQLHAAEVRENRRGEWISGAQDFETGKTHECSICGGFIDYSKGGADDYYFCPYCGADMRGTNGKS